jgi:magnesium-transporting ATPase (P-type)
MAYKYSYDREENEYRPPKLKTNRNMWKLMILNILTLGIYGIIFFIPFSFDIDKISPKEDRSKTFNYLFAYILSIFTLSIVLLFWHHQMAARLEEAIDKRKIEYDFSTSDFWMWYILGSFILIGPFVYFHKLCKAMNLLCESYNENPTIE